MKGVFYRSDTRDPQGTDQLFANGFSKRNSKYTAPILRLVAGPKKAPDIIPESAVCVTRYFEAAPLFPVGDLKTDSWVYVLDLDTDTMTNTQQSQWSYVQLVDQGGVASALWPMFGQERAVDSIAAGDIVGAVYVSRKFNSDNVFNGGSFLPTKYLANPGYTGPGTTAKLAADLIGPLVKDKKWIDMPTQAQGIVKSTGQ